MHRLEAMRAAQFSSRGATPHEEQALLKQAKLLAAQHQAGQSISGGRGKGSKGRGKGAASGRPGTANGPESPPPNPQLSGKPSQAPQGKLMPYKAMNICWICL